MGLKSRQKGKRGELEAAAFLRECGFISARRTQQYNGDGKSDVVCDELPNLHIEVKYGYPKSDFDIGTTNWQEAFDQAHRDAAGKPCCVLWRNKGGRIWKLTFLARYGLVTVCGIVGISAVCRELNGEEA